MTPQPYPPPPSRPSWLIPTIVAGLAVLLLGAIAVGIVLIATIQGRPAASAKPSPSPSWSPYYWPTATTSPTPDDVSVELGDQLVSEGSSGSEVRYVVTAATAPRNRFGQPPEKGSYYAVRLKAEVITGSAYVYGGSVALVAADGQVYEGAGVSVGFDGALDAVDLNAGQKTEGLVIFDIPKGAEVHGRIELRTGALSSNQAYWRLP